MALSAEHREFLLDHFSGLGPIDVKRMFGGAGLYLGNACFAILLGGEQIMMRGDARIGPEFEEALTAPPSSAFVADGSAVVVRAGMPL